ncbi:hypothetical protein PV10_08133 [Exophiala mesophila]|uniref:Uncharacterized protein n=1 Tax=Exophiala mesophila TaxID=212818 RepID=A0A0D1WI13_EXOME|nr:uncharacterized protein PV10_08133 [Exophiala mesophila]KIV88450.1 hypothetical protein PV10_08133 [Exophiala mesophila]
MASPPEVTMTNLSGTFVLNKSLSDEIDPLFVLQGLSWFTRKAIGLATVVLTVKEYTKDSVIHIDITSVASGLSTTQENRTLDWQERDHSDRIFGNIKGRSRMWTTGGFEPVLQMPAEVMAFMLGNKLKDGQTDSRFLEDDHLHSFVQNVDEGYRWAAEQNWGFEEIDGKRYHTRRVMVQNQKGDKHELARLVYDYTGKA